MGQEHQIIVDGVHYVEKSIREDLKYIENFIMILRQSFNNTNIINVVLIMT